MKSIWWVIVAWLITFATCYALWSRWDNLFAKALILYGVFLFLWYYGSGKFLGDRSGMDEATRLQHFKYGLSVMLIGVFGVIFMAVSLRYMQLRHLAPNFGYEAATATLVGLAYPFHAIVQIIQYHRQRTAQGGVI